MAHVILLEHRYPVSNYTPLASELGGDDNIISFVTLDRRTTSLEAYVIVVKDLSLLQIDYSTFELRLLNSVKPEDITDTIEVITDYGFKRKVLTNEKLILSLTGKKPL